MVVGDFKIYGCEVGHNNYELRLIENFCKDSSAVCQNAAHEKKYFA